MTIYQTLEKYWGYSKFRSLQEDIIQSVLSGRDTLALMPTGGGKSICFQVPAMVNPGICLVISPLIALMKDQVENLTSKGIPAIAIISGMGKREVDIALDNCIYGPIKFLYLSPERLLSDLVKERIRHMKVNLFAIDEAHCISQWGYDFRPPYLHLTELRELHPKVPFLALTATATERVAVDIQDKLGFKKQNIFRKSFERKNLCYVVAHEENKFRKLINVAKKVAGCGIVYVRNRKKTQEVARHLNLQGLKAEFYHGGLETPLRMEKQKKWKDGQVDIMVATNAFGMGIDKSNVRFVVHLDLPESLEAYYQEAGRGGRDEKKAYAVLLYNNFDKIQLHKKLELSFPSIEEIKQTYHFIGNYYQLAYGAGQGLSLEFDVADFCNRFKLDAIKTLHALKFLERNEYIALSESVYLPSRMQIIVSHEELYRFQIEQPGYDLFIKTILRSYGGVYDQFVSIKEFDIANRMGLRKSDVINMLQVLQSSGFINYVPQTDKPYLQFIQQRVDNDHVYLDKKYLKDRYEICKQQIESVIAYAELSICRSQTLLAYFDEANAPECGVCDVCLSKKRAGKQAMLFDEITNDIFNLLSSGPMLLDDLVGSLNMGSSKDKLAIIRILLDTGKIKPDGERYYI